MLLTDSLTTSSSAQLIIHYYQRLRGTKRMVDMSFEFTELCTTIPPLEYGGNENLLVYFAAKVNRAPLKPARLHARHLHALTLRGVRCQASSGEEIILLACYHDGWLPKVHVLQSAFSTVCVGD